ncbi:MAG: prepilin peptidase [Solirubrobacterales bacterium]
MFLVFLFGTVIGSFLNVCIYRIPKGESILFPPSHCTKCLKKISLNNLIPIVSYMLLKGKSSCCSSKISMRYPFIEMLAGFLFVLTYFTYGFGVLFLKWIFFISLIIVIGFIDMDTNDVYLNSIIFGIIGAVVFIIVQLVILNISNSVYIDCLLGGLAGFSIIGAIIILTNGMGFGDAEICAMAGLFLGLEKTVLMVVISFIAGGIAGGYFMLSKEKGRKDSIPFAPFIAFSSIITIIFGNSILQWYIW